MKYLALALFALCAACAPSPTRVWLSEYEGLLKDTVKAIADNPDSTNAERMRLRLSQKEEQINTLLKDSDTQEQMTFLSEYYDMRVKYFYQLQQQ